MLVYRERRQLMCAAANSSYWCTGKSVFHVCCSQLLMLVYREIRQVMCAAANSSYWCTGKNVKWCVLQQTPHVGVQGNTSSDVCCSKLLMLVYRERRQLMCAAANSSYWCTGKSVFHVCCSKLLKLVYRERRQLMCAAANSSYWCTGKDVNWCVLQQTPHIGVQGKTSSDVCCSKLLMLVYREVRISCRPSIVYQSTWALNTLQPYLRGCPSENQSIAFAFPKALLLWNCAASLNCGYDWTCRVLVWTFCRNLHYQSLSIPWFVLPLYRGTSVYSPAISTVSCLTAGYMNILASSIILSSLNNVHLQQYGLPHSMYCSAAYRIYMYK